MINLLERMNQPQQPSKNFADYSILFYAKPKTGTSTLIHELYGDKVFFLFSEDRYRHMTGAYLQKVNSWEDFLMCVAQLKNQALKDKFQYVAIDTLDSLFKMCEEHTLQHFDIEALGEAPKGADYVYLRNEFNDKIMMISGMGYTPIYACHEDTELIKVPASECIGIDTSNMKAKYAKGDKAKETPIIYEYERKRYNIKDKNIQSILNNVDNIFHIDLQENKATGEQMRVVNTRTSMYHVAGATPKFIPPVIPMGAKEIKEAFQKALDKEFGEAPVDESKVECKVESRPYETVYEECVNLCRAMVDLGKQVDLAKIIESHLGVGAKIATHASPEKVDKLELIILDLKEIL